MENVIAYFENHPKETEVHQTSNGFLFKNKADAEAHATTLKKEEREIKTHEKGKLEKTTAPVKPKTKKELEAEAKAAQEEADKKAIEELEAEEAAKKSADGGQTTIPGNEPAK